MTIVNVVDSESAADVILQVITHSAEGMTMISSHVLSCVEELACIYMSHNEKEADIMNDGILYVLKEATVWHGIKAVKVYFCYENYYLYPNAIPVRLVDAITEAGWKSNFITNYGAKLRFQKYREKLSQPRVNLNELSDYLSDRYKANAIPLPKDYVQILTPLEIYSNISNDAEILGVLSIYSIVRVSLMCEYSDSCSWRDNRTRLKLKLASSDENLSRGKYSSVKDTTFGSDGWITYQIGTEHKNCIFIDPPKVNADIDSHGVICTTKYESGDDVKYVNIGFSSDSSEPLFHLFPRNIKSVNPFIFYAFKFPIGKKSKTLWGKPRLPRYRCFQLKDGLLSYYKNYKHLTESPNSPLKERRVLINGCKAYIRSPTTLTVGNLCSLSLQYLRDVMCNHHFAVAEHHHFDGDTDSDSESVGDCHQNPVEKMNNDADNSGVNGRFFKAFAATAVTNMKNVFNFKSKNVNVKSDEEDAPVITSEFDYYWDVIYIQWNFQYDSKGHEIAEDHSDSDTLMLFVKKNYSYVIINHLCEQGAIIEREWHLL